MMPRPLRGLKGGAWLGWMVESNWTEPFLFAGYVLVKPLAQSLILAVIYLVVQRRADTPFFAAMMVGNAFFLAIGQVLAGTSWCVIEDREFYGTIRYVYLAGRSMVWYLLGRAVARLALAALSIVVLLAFARWAMGAPLAVEPRWVGPGLVALGLGLGATAGMGLGLAGVAMLATRNGQFYSEAVGGAMLLLSGAIFPLDVLPPALQAVARWLPQSYWLEAMRRLLSPSASDFSASLGALSDGALLARLGLAAAVWTSAGLAWLWLAQRRVRRTGTLDARTES